MSCRAILLLSLLTDAATESGLTFTPVAVTSHCAKGQWCALPANFLSAREAFEFALLRVNEMRQKCSGFALAPVRRQDYVVAGTVRKDMDGYSVYKLLLNPVNKFVPTALEIEVAHLHRITDLSIFQVTKVKPAACSLFSEADDAMLMVPTDWKETKEAAELSRRVLNEQRKILCPERPSLQLLRILAAARQPAEGKVYRLQLELREELEEFGEESGSFEEQVLVSYALDHQVPQEMALSAEVYAGRYPCRMVHEEKEQTALDFLNSTTVRRLHEERRLSWDPVSASEAVAAGNSQVERHFVEQGLDLPDDFDPRVEKTLCFPRGLSRSQGSCGASWAFASTAVASFRECLSMLHRGEQPAALNFFSAQELVSCSAHMGCSGGSAAEAFYYMKQRGVARETCSPYRMRCFHDQSTISMEAADYQTNRGNRSSCSKVSTDESEFSSCKCLPGVFHLTSVVVCDLLPAACPKTKIPSYFKMLGTKEGNSVPRLERHIMQELLTDGPLYVSLLLYEDFFDASSWSESGIYLHEHGQAFGRHGASLVGWGTDSTSRDYWLLLNSFGIHWQQGGYFKVLRGDTDLEMLHYGAWGVDFELSKEERKRSPAVFAVEVSFSPVPERHGMASEPLTELEHVWLRVAFATDEPATTLVRVLGLASGITSEVAENATVDEAERLEAIEGAEKHTAEMDLLKHDLLGDRLELRIWASDSQGNTGGMWAANVKVKTIQARCDRIEDEKMLIKGIMDTGGFERIDETIERFRAKTFGENYELMLKAVGRHGQALKFASFERLEQKLIHNLVLTAVRSSGMSLAHAPVEMQGKKDLVMEAVKQNGMALQFAAEEMREDSEVVLQAVSQHGLALQFAEGSALENELVVLAAVAQDGEAFKLAPETMQTKKDIVEKAVLSSPKVLQYVPSELRKVALDAVKSSPQARAQLERSRTMAGIVNQTEQEIERMEELADTKRYVKNAEKTQERLQHAIELMKSVRPHVAAQKPKKAVKLTLLALQTMLEHTQDPSLITKARTAVEKHFNSVVEDQKQDFLDFLFDRDVALSASLRDSIFACLVAYKHEMLSKAPIQIDAPMSQPLRRYSLAAPSREPSKEPPIPERDARRTVTEMAGLR